MDITPTSVFR